MAQGAASAPAVPIATVPAGAVIYKVNSSRASFGELWRDTRSAMVILAWATKVLRVRMPGGVNDPNVESLRPFAVGPKALPADVLERMTPKLREFAALGFDLRCVAAFVVRDLYNSNHHYVATVGRSDGRAVGRVVLRREGGKTPPKTHAHCDVLTEFADGRFLWTSGARAWSDAPGTMTLVHEVNGTVSQLWARHEAALAGRKAAGGVRPAVGRAGMLELLDRHHAATRDFHLRRGLFAPLTEVEQANADAIQSSFAGGVARGSASPDILAEIERLQANKTGWMSGLLLLVVSVAAFVGLGLRGGSGTGEAGSSALELLAMTVPILLFHEGGHYLAMRVFRYRNVRMFFIPGFGAAVSGQGYGAPGWKKVIVSLMGPLPGIAAAAVLGIVGIALHHPLAVKAAMLGVILNGFNLLPVLPMDGGRVVQYLLFSRHWGLDIGFRVVAAGVLIAAGTLTSDRFLAYLGVGMLLSVPVSVKVGRIAAELKREGLTPVPTGDHRIPPDVADLIVDRVRARFTDKKGKLNKKMAARHTLSVYEAVCARPPGWAASLGFGALHAGGFGAALVLVLVFALFSNGRSFDDVVREIRLRQQLGLGFGTHLGQMAPPKYAISPGDTSFAGDPANWSTAATRATTNPANLVRSTVIANFNTRPQADAAFESLRDTVKPNEAFERLGQTLLLSLPAEDSAERHRWLAAMEASRGAEVAVRSPKSFTCGLRITGVAPSAEAAAAVQQELHEYLSLPSTMDLLPPWTHHPADPARWAEARRARQTFERLQRLRGESYRDPRVKTLTDKEQAASQDGDQTESEQLAKRAQAMAAQVYHEQLAHLQGESDPTVDPVVLAAFLKLPVATADVDDDDDSAGLVDPKSPAYGEMAERMGRVAAGPEEGALGGFVKQEGTTVSIEFVLFVDPVTGGPELVDWLGGRGVHDLRYEFDLPTARKR